MTRHDVSVVIPTHSHQRFEHLVQAVASAADQSHAPRRIVVAVDHNEALLQRATAVLSGEDRFGSVDVEVVPNRFARGVSGNRNAGAAAVDTELMAFLDDDTIANHSWLANLVAPLADPSVVGTGGAIRPLWSKKPRWVPDEFLWAYGASYVGMPATAATVRNVWSASMAVRRADFVAAGGFRVGFGKLGNRSRPEDTELCLRLASGGGRWVYVPQAVIDHRVEPQREKLRYFLTRCYNEGRGKVAMARLFGQKANSLKSEQDYLRTVVPHSVRDNIGAALRGRDDWAAMRAGAAVVGVLAAGAGALAEIATVTGDRPC